MRDREELNITDARSGAAFTVKIVPKANKTEIIGLQADGTIKIRLMSPPVDGQANAELVDFLSTFLGIGKDDVEIVAGVDGRKKLISVYNIRADEVEKKVHAVVPNSVGDDDDD